MTAQPWEPGLARLEGAYEQIAERLGDLTTYINARFVQIDARFVQIDARFDQLESRMDSRFAQMESRFTRMDGRIDALGEKVESNLKTIIGWMMGQTALSITAVIAVAFALRR